MVQQPIDRRSVLRTLGVGATAIVTGCSGKQNGDSSGTQEPTLESIDLVQKNLADRLESVEMVNDKLLYVALKKDDTLYVTHGNEEHQSFFDIRDDFWIVGGDLVYQAVRMGDDGQRQNVIVRGGEVAEVGQIHDVDDGSILRTESANGETIFYDDGMPITFQDYGPVTDAAYVDEGVAAVVQDGQRPNAILKDGEVLDRLSDTPLPNAIPPVEHVGGYAEDPIYDKYVEASPSSRVQRHRQTLRDGKVVFEDSRPWIFSPSSTLEIDRDLAFILTKTDEIEDDNRSRLSKLWIEGEEFGPHERIMRSSPSYVNGKISYNFQDYDEEGTRLMHGGDEIGTEYRSAGGLVSINGTLAYAATLPPEDRPEDAPDKDQVVVYGGNELGPYNRVGNIFEYEGRLAFEAETEEGSNYGTLFHEQ